MITAFVLVTGVYLAALFIMVILGSGALPSSNKEAWDEVIKPLALYLAAFIYGPFLLVWIMNPW